MSKSLVFKIFKYDRQTEKKIDRMAEFPFLFDNNFIQLLK